MIKLNIVRKSAGDIVRRISLVMTTAPHHQYNVAMKIGPGRLPMRLNESMSVGRRSVCVAEKMSRVSTLPAAPPLLAIDELLRCASTSSEDRVSMSCFDALGPPLRARCQEMLGKYHRYTSVVSC